MRSDLLDIRKSAEKTVKDTTEWQKEQKEREVIINKKISMQAEHIKYDTTDTFKRFRWAKWII